MDWSSDSDSGVDADEVKPITENGGSSRHALHDNDDDTDQFNWDTDDDEVYPSHDVASIPLKEVTEAGPSNTNHLSHFVAMGFSAKLVAKAIEQNREGDTDGILETLLTYGAVDGSSPSRNGATTVCPAGSDNDASDDDISDMDDFDFEDITDQNADNDRIVSTLVEMGFLAEEASSAIDRCGPNTSILELADSISAAQMQEDSGDRAWVESSDDNDEQGSSHILRTRLKVDRALEKRQKRIRTSTLKSLGTKKHKPTDDDEIATMSIPKPMIGFGLPFEPAKLNLRRLSEASVGPPYFYYENVALAPKGVWDTISRFLYDIEPEFVDSKFFSAAARKRGYIHNLPIKDRFPLLPIPPKTIFEAFPSTKNWWPSWDTRTHLNCLQTCIASAKLTERIRSALASSPDPPPENIQKWIMFECRKWNLVWIGKNKVAPLEPDEIEMLLGFPRNHTRGISRTERYKSLGNSFQIDTVAYHLSVLRDMFPNGITVLSLFSGIGGAEVALHRLGIRLKLVVSVELSDNNRNVVRSWWDQTNQNGTLIHISDVQQLNSDRLEHFIKTYNAFDLVIGGSPCNNLAGSNRHHRDGLEGEHSSLFYDYFRILDLVKCIMGQN